MLSHAVQLIWATLVTISFTDLLRFALLTFADNACLLDVSLHIHNFYSFATDLHDLMIINSYYAVISLYE